MGLSPYAACSMCLAAITSTKAVTDTAHKVANPRTSLYFVPHIHAARVRMSNITNRAMRSLASSSIAWKSASKIAAPKKTTAVAARYEADIQAASATFAAGFGAA